MEYTDTIRWHITETYVLTEKNLHGLLLSKRKK